MRIVHLRNGHGVQVAVVFEKVLSFSVAAHLHLLGLHIGPLVHREGPDKADVHPETAMLSAAVQAYKGSGQKKKVFGSMLGA